ncbi:MAG TPA: choice-of-anchor D domain-containing protein, partial [Candidatus Kapabacteria bacterium]|nr:choice-of-anchor D domain-containing protein [Candidatus Kapabacteria bacterium]
QGSRSGNGWRATSSAVFALDSNNYRPDGWTSCDAAGLPIFPGLVRLDECKAGAINHALRFTVPHTQKGWIFPARHEAGSTSDTTYMPMGLRMRLKAKFDDSKDTGYAKVIITALKKYGIILADNGSSWYISGETNTNWPDDDLNQLKAITGNDFEAVYTGPVRTQPNEYPDPVLPVPSNGGIQVPTIARDTARVGDANAVIIPVVNNGSSALTISRYWLKYGSVFQIADSATHSIAAGGSAEIDVDFLPIIHGEAVDTLFIASNDPATPTTATALAGMGTEGVFHLSANPLDFGSVTIGNADTMVIVLTNPGDGELDVNATSSTGTSPDFTIIGIGPQASPPFVLMPGDTEFALVQFTPSTVGPDTSLFALTFSDTSGEEYDTVLIAVGEGLSPASVTSPAQPGPFALSIFPNPTAGSMQISTSGFGGRVSLIILNSLGQTVWAGWTDAATKNVDLSLLPNGSYFVHATGPNGSAAQRIVLEH